MGTNTYNMNERTWTVSASFNENENAEDDEEDDYNVCPLSFSLSL